MVSGLGFRVRVGGRFEDQALPGLQIPTAVSSWVAVTETFNRSLKVQSINQHVGINCFAGKVQHTLLLLVAIQVNRLKKKPQMVILKD